MIYFVRDTLSGLIKIGYSANPWLRLCKMQSDCPGRLELLATAPGSQLDERALHGRLVEARTRGEWFRATPPVLSEVAAATPFSRAALPRPDDARGALIADLAEATGASGNAVRGWVERGRVPGGYIAAVSRAGILTIEQMCAAAERNYRRARGSGAAPILRLEDLAAERREKAAA